jgi:hypothetical protein
MTGDALPVAEAAVTAAAPLNVPRPPLAIADSLSRELVHWLVPPDVVATRARFASWPASTWRHLPRAIAMHGLAPHLARSLDRDVLQACLPPAVRTWIEAQDAANERRIRRFHADLRRILAAAATAGIPVMPLKGALLTTLPGADPFRRPMADLDLLVRPGDRVAMGGVLERLGYRHAPERNPRPTHEVFLDPAGSRRISADGEHPDNPRRVELHVEVRPHLWAWVDRERDDLTPMLWAGATSMSILGLPAMVPDAGSRTAHLAIHASSDLLVGRGRLVQWLDLASAAPDLDLARLPHARHAYPALALAARAVPEAFGGVDLGRLEASMPPALVRWAATVPFDHRAGLTAGRSPDQPSSWSARWERWRPDPWRLAVAYGRRSRPSALVHHAPTIGERSVNRG